MDARKLRRQEQAAELDRCRIEADALKHAQQDEKLIRDFVNAKHAQAEAERPGWFHSPAALLDTGEVDQRALDASDAYAAQFMSRHSKQDGIWDILNRQRAAGMNDARGDNGLDTY